MIKGQELESAHFLARSIRFLLMNLAQRRIASGFFVSGFGLRFFDGLGLRFDILVPRVRAVGLNI